jgi:predicted RNase H-like nuclease
MPAARSCIREVHPEVCFQALNHSQAMQNSKKTTKGFDERKKVLRAVYAGLSDLLLKARQWKRAEVAKDDILDALAAALTAQQGRGRLKSLPDSPELDAYGFKMEMLYFQ